MSKLKFFVFVPDEEDVIKKVIDAAAEAGAGKIGNYSHCAFIIKGQGNWKPLAGSNPTVGKVGEMSRENEAKIEMECERKDKEKIVEAIKKVHPYEKVAIDFMEMV